MRSFTHPLPTVVHAGELVEDSNCIYKDSCNSIAGMRRQRSSSEPAESTSTQAVELSTSLGTCSGILVQWPKELGSFNDTFPWSRIGDEPDSLSFIITVNRDGKRYAFSKTCSQKSLDSDLQQPCVACGSDVPKGLEGLVGIVRQANKFLRHSLLSASQLRGLLSDCNTEINRWKLKMLNMARKLNTATRRTADYKRFIMAISEKDVPRIQSIVQTVLRNGASISAVFSGLPSLRTLRNQTVFTRIMPTVGHITQKEIDHNIREVVIKSLEDADGSPRAEASPRGMSLLIDEISLEESAVHFCHANSVGGLCWKHSNMVDLVLCTFQSALNIAQSLTAGSVHMGKEMTVVSLSFFGIEGTYPILAAPTCKQETADDMQFILELILKSWKESPGTAYGQIWSVATDGDSTRRACGFKMFLKNELSPSSPLYGTLYNMPGLNLYTGDDEMTLDFDYKHIFKRICMLIRSPTGITLNGSCLVTSTLLERYLVICSGKTVSNAKRLLNPEDPQDVPRAIELMQAVIALGTCTVETNHPNVVVDMDAIKYLAALLEAILEPFINTDLSLQDQTMVKNLVFCVTKQQKRDPMAPFYAFETGDDRLENLFGCIRMLGAHDSGMNFCQGVERLGHAIDIDCIFLRRPELDIRHRCLSTTRKEGVDHINAAAWKGDVSVYCCDLPFAWAKGREATQMMLKDSQMPAQSSEFLNIFLDRQVDMLRPFGQGIYPGLSTLDSTEDRSIDLLQPSASPAPVRSDDDIGVTLEDTVDEVPALNLPSAKGVNPDDYLMCGNGKPVHKMSICRLVITPDYMQKSNNRPERVRGYKKFKANAFDDLNTDDITAVDTFIVGDRVVALI
ncbi:hypothetical protein EWM64_g8800 [Hericium alpestre]|uniref:Uncharacterized protein n=1 Tax=Hericium alpestre TaxID=135208 RepID=A0A4Y9ZKT6_9AGAM|nr:hypothetical protein EWM64_g8800 [Hericium alpestre]